MFDLIPEQYCKKDLIIRHLQVTAHLKFKGGGMDGGTPLKF